MAIRNRDSRFPPEIVGLDTPAGEINVNSQQSGRATLSRARTVPLNLVVTTGCTKIVVGS